VAVVALLASLPWSVRAAAPADGAAASPPPAADAPAAVAGERAIAIFAGGCFWCMEPPYDELPGVISTTSGYIGGDTPEPTYEQVTSGATGHAEAVQVVYDPSRISYPELLEVFWRNVDPLTENRQFCDVGSQYRSAVFYLNERQRSLAEQSRRQVAGRFDDPVVTEIAPAGTFYPAEPYHQDYYQKNPLRYRFYRFGCGRDARLRELWGEQAGG
jgi:peptide-methionine (S)-S-oxide reductase